MAMRISAFVFAFAAVLGLASVASADSGFRCGSGRLVSVGDRMDEVLERCGEPDAVIQRMEKRKVKHKVTRRVGNVEESIVEEEEIEVPVDEWAYDMGRYVFIRYVVFENGKVINVETGKYGSK
jgi:hypothetical protein